MRPRIWDADYCLLLGLAATVGQFSAKYVEADMKILDFGCGAKPYRGLLPENCTYIGVDTCRSKYADIIIEPGQPVPLPDASVDCIISTQVVCLVPQYGFYMRECRRLLRQEGRMLITTHGAWTYHPASGGDYYRFTQDGLRYILQEGGFEVETMTPIVGTLGTGLHLRQLIFNGWLKRRPLGGWTAKLLNILTNVRILIEDRLSPVGTRMSSPVILAAIAYPVRHNE